MDEVESEWEGRASRGLHRCEGARAALCVLSLSRTRASAASEALRSVDEGLGVARRTRARADVCSFVAEPGARADAWNMLELDLEEGQNY